jgi:malate synthase
MSSHTEAGSLPTGVELKSPVPAGAMHILTADAVSFIAKLAREFQPRRSQLLQRRLARQQELDAGVFPDFLTATQAIRANPLWQVAGIPADLRDRRTEITGPVDRKMVINALNSGAKVFMADFEDATAPTWQNVVEGQANLFDAVRRNISFATAEKSYRLNETTATLMVRPRGWHLPEKQVWVDGHPMSGSLFDFGLFFITTRANSWRAAAGRISICRSWRVIWRRGCGMTCSISPRPN